MKCKYCGTEPNNATTNLKNGNVLVCNACHSTEKGGDE